MPVKMMIVDYGTCNVHSVYKVLKQMGVDVTVSCNPADLRKVDKIILPGIGHFDHAMKSLVAMNLKDSLNEQVLVKKTPILGICLGMQLMADSSEEGEQIAGLGWISGRVVALTTNDKVRFKIPHMGWNTVQIIKDSVLMKEVKATDELYFTHSYHFQTKNKENILNSTEYDKVFVSAIQNDHIFGVQYHPEKSHVAGSLILRNFANF